MMEYRKLSELTKLANNPRQITKKEFADLCQSIKDDPEWFEARPLILSNRTGKLIIIAGNTRFEAAKSIGLAQAPTHLIEGMDEAREKKIIIMDNTHQGQWNFDILANEWDDLPLNDWGLNIPQMVDPSEEWVGMPEFNNPAKATKDLIIHFEKNEDMESFSKLINQKITDKTTSIWYPERESRDMKSVEYKNES
jgi:hypothetical protein